MEGKKYACFSKEQQKAFDKLNAVQQKYVLLRGQGYNRSESYRLAGYKELKYAGQSACKLEKVYHPEMASLIESLQGVAKINEVYENDNSKFNKAVDKKASEPPVEMAQLVNAEGNLPDPNRLSQDQAEQIQFYRQIANGTIKTERVTKKYDGEGNLISRTVERVSDIDMRIKARKELSRILGIDRVVDIGQIEAGEINITIVDASKRETDEKDKVVIPEGSYTVVEDEQGN